MRVATCRHIAGASAVQRSLGYSRVWVHRLYSSRAIPAVRKASSQDELRRRVQQAASQEGVQRTAEVDLDSDDYSLGEGEEDWAKLEKLLIGKSYDDCDGDMCDMDWGGEEEGKVGSVLGASLLIAGSALGGGMLAVPAATAPAGFVPAVTAMSGMWVFLVLEGLLLAEITVMVASRLQRRSASILSLSRVTLGASIGTAAAGCYALLCNATLISQIMRGGSILHELMPVVPYGCGVLTVCLGGASLIYFNSSSRIDSINKVLTGALIVSFLGLMFCGLHQADWSRLVRMDWSATACTVPTILQVLNFQVLIPLVCTYLGMDKQRIRKAVIAGSLIPLVMVSCWTGMATGLVPFVPGAAVADPMDVLLLGGGGTLVSGLVSAFAGCAVITTVMGMLMSMHEFWAEAFRKKQKPAEPQETSVTVSSSNGCSNGTATAGLSTSRPKRRRTWLERVISLMTSSPEIKSRATTIIPAIVASLCIPPDAFGRVLSFSGSYLVTCLFGLMPPLMVLAIKGKTEHSDASADTDMDPVPAWLLATLLAISVTLIGGSLLMDTHLMKTAIIAAM